MRAVLRAYRDAYSDLPAQVWWLSAAVFVNRAGKMVLPFLALFLTRERGLSIEAVGVYLFLYGAGSMAGIAAGGWLVDRIGAKFVMAASLVASALALLILAEMRTPVSIGAMLIAFAVCGESFRPANATALAAAAPPERQARAFGLNRLAINLGMTAGPALGGLLAQVDYAWLFYVDAATCLGAACVLAVRVRPLAPPTRAERERAVLEGRSPWRDRVLLIALGLALLQALIVFQLQGTLVVYLGEHRGFSEGLVGLLFALNTVLIVIFEMVLIRRVERLNPLRVVGVGGLFFGLGYGLLPVSGSVWWVAFTVTLWTFGEMLFAPVLSAFVAARSDPSNRGRYMALFGMNFSVATMIAPLLGTRIYGGLGPTALWLACLALGLVSWAGFVALAGRGGGSGLE